jgi:hypothetical protein
MKTLLSIFALTLALAFTGPAFAGDVTAAKTEADCAKAGGTWNATTKMCDRFCSGWHATALSVWNCRLPGEAILQSLFVCLA